MQLEQIYHQYKSMVYNLALSYVQNTEDAEEITQDVFFSVYKAIAMFKGKATLSTWIYRITINKALDHIKAKNRAKRFGKIISLFTIGGLEKEQFIELHHPGLAMEHKEEVSKIFEAINQLPANQKTALILHKLEGLSHHEIAVILEVSVKAVGALVVRAKENLNKKLNTNEEK